MKTVLAAFAFFLLGLAAFGDAPLPEPTEVNVCSYNHEYCVTSKPGEDTVVERRSNPAATWRIPGWCRSIYVSNAGYVVIGFDGLNLLPIPYDPDTVMIEIWKDGKQIHKLLLTDLVTNMRRLQRTASHYYWGEIEGFDEDGDLAVNTIDRGVIRIDVATGKKNQ